MARRVLLMVAAAATCAACSSKSSTKLDSHLGSEPPPQTGSDAPPATVDAFPLAPCTPVSGSTVTTRLIGTVTGSATLATSPPHDGRLFVLEQSGRIRIFENETLVAAPFLDLSDGNGGPVNANGNELGLLGLAFDPQYATNHYFYVDYTATNPDTTDTGNPFVDVVVRYQASASNPDLADPSTATTILSIPDPFSNHNAGMIEFGSDGYLYIATGDGGSAGDPHRNGQNTNALLAKILRIDVEHPANGKPYGIPADNPFATSGGAPEVFLFGVRNPWRWTFDRGTGDMWIADVGQNQTEELDVLTVGHQAGTNLGWSAYEGSACCATQADKCSQSSPQQACDPTGKVFPQLQKSHGGDGWLAIIGGQVYRGTCFPDLVGKYLFTDNVHAGITEATLDGSGGVTANDLPGTFPKSPSSIHADARGELYETTTSGAVYRIEAGP